MDLKEKWVASFETFPHKDDILKDIRREALSFFGEKGFPHKKVEAWKYTSLKDIQATDYTLWQPIHTKKTFAPEVLHPYWIEGSHLLVFVNGFFSAEMSNTDGANFTVTPLLEALYKGGAPFVSISMQIRRKGMSSQHSIRLMPPRGSI